MKTFLIAVVSLFTLAIGASFAYGYEETVELPSSDYLGYQCYAVVWNPYDWEYHCVWGYGDILQSVEYPRNGTIIVPDNRLDDPMGNLIDKVNEEISKLKVKDGMTVVPDKAVPKTTTEPKTERDIAVDELDQCLRGFERFPSWGAFQESSEILNYQNKTREQFSIRDNLSKEIPTLKILKAIEECNAIQVYVERGNIGAYEANRAIADKLGLDYLGRSEIASRGNEASLGYINEKTATQEEKQHEADRARDWACAPEQKHLKLCVSNPFTGTNRGNPEPMISDNVNTGIFLGNQTSKQIMDKYREEQASNILTEQDITNNEFKQWESRCKIMWNTSGKGALTLSKWPMALASGFCDDKLESDWLMMNSNNRFDNVQMARDYRLQLDAVIHEEFRK